MKATKIKMKSGCYNSTKTTEISKIYIEGCKNPGFFDKSVLHDYLQTTPYPDLIPATSISGEKYVRSEPNDTPNDNLLRLPRC